MMHAYRGMYYHPADGWAVVRERAEAGAAGKCHWSRSGRNPRCQARALRGSVPRSWTLTSGGSQSQQSLLPGDHPLGNNLKYQSKILFLFS